ncbi:MAG: alpha/beta hydrolase [Flavobacteriaceae bacterium]|nr:alpha/beta hydrolase [Flavobacteriaceae bacterium]
MKKLLPLMFIVFFISCEKEESQYDLKSSLENTLGVLASQSPLGGDDLFFKDVSYGNGTRNVLDVLMSNKGESNGVVLFFHGGAFVAGDKEDAYNELLKETMESLLANNITIISANYTFINSPGNKGVISALEDGTAVIDFIQSQSNALLIPANKMVLAGVSAGAGIAQWNGFQASSNTQVQGILAIAAQSTYDLYDWENVFPGFSLDSLRGTSPVLETLFSQFYNGEPTQEDLDAVDYRAFMDATDPPLYVFNQAGDELINSQGALDFDVLYHSFRHSDYLRAKAIEVGLPFSGVYAEGLDAFVLRVLK